MKLILEDIEQAVLLFPEDGYINKNLASKPAAYALKADVLMWKAKVLNGGNADLEENKYMLLESDTQLLYDSSQSH